MNEPSAGESPVKYYDSRQSRSVWGALVFGVCVIAGGASLAAHSFTVTSSLLIGAVVVWYGGRWLLSKSVYFISDSKAGFKDVFQLKEVRFDEIQSVNKYSDRGGTQLIFACKNRTVTMPIDPMDGAWFSAVKAELVKRGIPLSSTAYGFTVKDG